MVTVQSHELAMKNPVLLFPVKMADSGEDTYDRTANEQALVETVMAMAID